MATIGNRPTKAARAKREPELARAPGVAGEPLGLGRAGPG